MARPFSKRLVVDASVARSAGGPPEVGASLRPLGPDASPGALHSRQCRKILRLILKICHRLVWTRPISDEWKKHASRFSRTWRTAMLQKDKIVVLEVPADDALREGIDEAAKYESHRAAMQKDRHLIEAALEADQAVISLNEADRKRFASACDAIPILKNVVWVNPDRVDDNCEQWLKSGANTDAPLRLRNYNPE